MGREASGGEASEANLGVDHELVESLQSGAGDSLVSGSKTESESCSAGRVWLKVVSRTRGPRSLEPRNLEPTINVMSASV